MLVLTDVRWRTWTIAIVIGACFLPMVIRAEETATSPSAPLPLFNGHNLDGWYSWTNETGYDDPNQVFSVVDGLLRLSGQGQGFLATEDSFRDYILVFEFRWGGIFDPEGPRAGGAKDSGIVVHSKGTDGEWKDRLIPGIQSQMVEGGMGDIMIMSTADNPPYSFTAVAIQEACGPNTEWNCRGGWRWEPSGEPVTFDMDVAEGGHLHNCYWDPNWENIGGFRGTLDTESPDGDWNQMVIVADEGDLEVHFNGIKVNELSNLNMTEGRIQLQLERFEYFVRRLELLPLGSPVGPSISSRELPAGMALAPYSGQVAATGGTGSLTWQVSSGTLPVGIQLDSETGSLEGSPIEPGQSDFMVTVTDELGLEASESYRVEVGEFAPVTAELVADGLVLHLDSTQEVDVTGTTASAWNDLSGKGNDLTALGSPGWGVVQTPTGQPALTLDGEDDAFERLAALVDFPEKNDDRSMFLVARYNSTNWWAGISFGSASRNRSWGLNVKHPTGELVLHGYGGGNDLVSSTPGLGAGWLIQSGTTSLGEDIHYRNGEVIGSFTHAYDTGGDRLVIGEEIGGLGHVGMDVAAVLLYDRTLSPRELRNVEAYLRTRYLDATPPGDDIPPALVTPGQLFALQSEAAGAVVDFATTAIDGIDGVLPTVDEPASGSLFPSGESMVTTTATDSAGNIATADFLITVESPEALASRVLLEVEPGTGAGTEIRIETIPGPDHQLSCSPDLSTWELLATYPGDGEPKTHLHAPDPPDLPTRYFYKVTLSSPSPAP